MTGERESERRLGRAFVPSDDTPTSAVAEGHHADSLGRALDVVPDCARAHVTAELSEYEESLRRVDVDVAVAGEVRVVVQEAVIETGGVDARHARRVGFGIAADGGRQRGPPVPGGVSGAGGIVVGLVRPPGAFGPCWALLAPPP